MRCPCACATVEIPGLAAAMPDYVLITIVSLVPIAALALAFACGATRFAAPRAESAAEAEGAGDDARS
jgi:hypothetical protein